MHGYFQNMHKTANTVILLKIQIQQRKGGVVVLRIANFDTVREVSGLILLPHFSEENCTTLIHTHKPRIIQILDVTLLSGKIWVSQLVALLAK